MIGEFEEGGLGEGALRVLKDDVVRLWSCSKPELAGQRIGIL